METTERLFARVDKTRAIDVSPCSRHMKTTLAQLIDLETDMATDGFDYSTTQSQVIILLVL